MPSTWWIRSIIYMVVPHTYLRWFILIPRLTRVYDGYNSITVVRWWRDQQTSTFDVHWLKVFFGKPCSLNGIWGLLYPGQEVDSKQSIEPRYGCHWLTWMPSGSNQEPKWNQPGFCWHYDSFFFLISFYTISYFTKPLGLQAESKAHMLVDSFGCYTVLYEFGIRLKIFLGD
jgi:hypothetical protein